MKNINPNDTKTTVSDLAELLRNSTFKLRPSAAEKYGGGLTLRDIVQKLEISAEQAQALIQKLFDEKQYPVCMSVPFKEEPIKYYYEKL